MRLVDGSPTTIAAGPLALPNTAPVYNLEVEGLHTYFVGADGWLVHNGAKNERCPLNVTDKIDNESLTPPTKRGNAPRGQDGHPVELHHKKQDELELGEMTRTDHRLGD